MAYERNAGADRFLVVLNLAHEPGRVPAAARALTGRIAISTGMDRHGMPFDGSASVGVDEGIVVRLDG